MSKKILLLALTALSAALFALPAAASAQEIHIEGITSFTGTGGAGSLVAEGEPTITCTTTDVNNGVVNAGGTTGSMDLDFTGCHANVFGFTVKCHTTGSPIDNTVASGGTFHAITYNGHPAVLVTPNTTEIICASISNTHVEGNGIIGTITSPECGIESEEMTLSFSATGSTQNDREYTGTNYDLKAKTGSSGAQRTAGLNGTTTLNSGFASLNCT